MNIPVDKIYCIQYLEAPERREYMIDQFKRLDILDKVEFYNAINFKKIFPENILNNLNKDICSFPIMGCAISHYSVIKTAYALNYKSILVLEDDISFLKDENILQEYFNNIPNDWDYIKFIVPIDKTIKYNLPTAKHFLNFRDLNIISAPCAGAYMINRKAMKLYINYQESHPLKPADLIPYFYIGLKNLKLNSYTPNKTLMAPTIYLNKENKIIFGDLLYNFNKNDFFNYKIFLKSIINNNR